MPAPNSLKAIFSLIFLLCAVTASSAQTFTTIANFDGTDGWAPIDAPLVQGFDGNFYGDATQGGTENNGVVFKVSTSGTLTRLRSFDNPGQALDGYSPRGALVQDSSGAFYGTTDQGGTGPCSNGGCGTVFKVNAAGNLTLLYQFCSQPNCTDGASPMGSLVQGLDRNFYGTTSGGGANNAGTIFKITRQGILTTIYNFCSQTKCADGENPQAGLTLGTDGNFFGTTFTGGSGMIAAGTAFKVTPAGRLTTLYSFCSQTNCADGEYPLAPLTEGANGVFYGTTYQGGTGTGCGAGNQCGTVFRVSAAGALTTLHSFCTNSQCSDGFYPLSNLVSGTDGNLYGITEKGGKRGVGTIFQITSTGTLTTLHTFCQNNVCTDGEDPSSGLAQGTDGTFYGTTDDGGTSSTSKCKQRCGTVFSLSMGLGPFVKTNPTFGKVNSTVIILGYNLTGSTAVSFNGTASTTFTVVSDTEITARVPAGATTGTVQVVTPDGTLSSNVGFRVLP